MRFTKSIRWRLLLWLGLLLTGLITAFGVTAYRLHVAEQFTKLDEQLKRRVVALSAAVHSPGRPPQMDRQGPVDEHRESVGLPGPTMDGMSRPPHDDFNGPHGPGFGPPPEADQASPGLNARADAMFADEENVGFYFIIWKQRKDAVLKQSLNAPAGLARPVLPEHDTGTYTRTRGSVREAYHATERDNVVLVGTGIAPEQAEVRKFAALLVLGGAAALFVGLGGAYWLVNRALQPVGDIGHAARRIAEGKLSERINTAEADSELGELAGTLNDTFARLEKSFALQKQFVADAAHELRTPLAVMISESQLALSRERSPADYQESLAANLESAQQMRRLAESLLELARYDGGQEQLRREQFDLAALVQNCARQLRPLIEARKLILKLETRPTPCSGDPNRITQVITNLLTNAINYNREGGEILVAVSREGNAAVLDVADTGIGISAEDLAHMFERFYRTDKARTRASGGVGLGLAICKAIVEAHGGKITVASELTKGTTFTIRLPVGTE